MKKRYARILAATLSAAMVFTSAPANFTGVVEAKAGTVDKEYGGEDTAAIAALKTRLSALTTENKTITANVTDTESAAGLKAKIEGVIGTLTGGGSAEVELSSLKVDGKAPANGVAGAVTGKIAVKYEKNGDDAADETSELYVPIEEFDFTVEKLPNITTPDNIYIKADDIASTGYVFDNLKYNTVNPDTVHDLASYKADNAIHGGNIEWKGVADGGFDQLMTAACDVATPVTLESKPITVAQFNRYALTSSDSYKVNDKGNADPADDEYSVYKTVNVIKTKRAIPAEVAGYTGLDDGTCTSAVNYTNGLYATVQFGKTANTDISIVDATAKKHDAVSDPQVHTLPLTAAQLAKYKVLECNVNLADVDGPTTKTGAVLIGTTTDYPESEYITTPVPNGWTYNKTYQKYVKQVDLKITDADAVKVSKIDFPKSLAAGVTITAGDELGKVALAETSTKTGKFYLVGKTPKITDKASGADTKYDVVFVSNTPLEDDMHDQGGYVFKDNNASFYGLSGADTSKDAVLKKAAITVTVAKKEIKVDDVKPVNKLTKAESVYGLTYAQLFNKLEKDTENVTYTLKDAQVNDIIPCGKSTVTYVCKIKAANKDDMIFDNGKDTVEVTVDVDIKAPEFNATARGASHVAKQAGNYDGALVADLFVKDDSFKNTVIQMGDLRGADVDYTYQWFSESKGELYGQNTAGLNIDATKMGMDTYWCELTVNVKSTASTAAKKAWASVASKYTTPKRKVSVTQMTISSTTIADQVYGKINATASVTVKPATDYTVDGVKWYVEDVNTGKQVATIDDAPAITAGGVATAKVPTTLARGTYNVCAEITASGKDGSKDVAVEVIALTVTQADLPIDPTDVKYNKGDKVLTYGQAIKEIKFTAPKDAEKYGKYEFANANSILDAGADQTATLKFIPSEECLNNYKYENATYEDGYVEIPVTDITVEKANITVKANNLEVVAGSEVKASDVTYTVTGLVGTDTLAGLAIGITASIDEKVDTKVAGTYAGAIKLTAEATGNRANYNLPVSVEAADLIVKAATVAPSVTPTPTPAPVKQATAAKAKAVKAKATVKVGKKYTLKLKYAAGKKSTVKKVKWTSSKKSVATVSSKGKVTAKKAGKATITATITFKDGSKKKVKFKVTVK